MFIDSFQSDTFSKSAIRVLHLHINSLSFIQENHWSDNFVKPVAFLKVLFLLKSISVIFLFLLFLLLKAVWISEYLNITEFLLSSSKLGKTYFCFIQLIHLKSRLFLNLFFRNDIRVRIRVLNITTWLGKGFATLLSYNFSVLYLTSKTCTQKTLGASRQVPIVNYNIHPIMLKDF